ncbi:MAG: hypothetical protein WCC52_08205 [Nitrosotalea sp.]
MSEESELIQEIKDHIASRGGSNSEWYVGIAKDPEQRLFVDHNVNKDTDKWIHRKASSSTIARNVEGHFINKLHTDGDVGGGDDTTIHVYAFRENSHTRR